MATLFSVTHNVHLTNIQRPNSPYLDKVLTLFDDFINAKGPENQFLYLERVLLPLIKKVFRVCDTAVPSDAELIKWATDTLSTHVVSFTTAECKDLYAETDPSGVPTIYWSQSWLAEAQIVYDANFTNLNYNHESLFVMNIHLAFGVMKFGHEFAHSLTRKIMSFEFTNRQQTSTSSTDPPPIELKDTPPMVGTMFKIKLLLLETWAMHLKNFYFFTTFALK
jgi:hypothetical protein